MCRHEAMITFECICFLFFFSYLNRSLSKFMEFGGEEIRKLLYYWDNSCDMCLSVNCIFYFILIPSVPQRKFNIYDSLFKDFILLRCVCAGTCGVMLQLWMVVIFLNMGAGKWTLVYWKDGGKSPLAHWAVAPDPNLSPGRWLVSY